jgi:two-component system response regulator NreC
VLYGRRNCRCQGVIRAEGRNGIEGSPWGRSSGRIRILLVDDHAVLRQALRLLLDAHQEVEVIGDVSNGREAVETVEKLMPDVVLMDMVMQGLNGLEATRQIRKRVPKTKVLILTGYMEDDHIMAALRAGASGYVVKKSDVTELLLGIQAVHRGNTYFSSAISDTVPISELLWQAQKGDGKAGYELLTSRRSAQLIAEGHSNQRIADDLFISVKTVEAHKAHIASKLHAQNRTDLIRYAIRKGILLTPKAPDLTTTMPTRPSSNQGHYPDEPSNIEHNDNGRQQARFAPLEIDTFSVEMRGVTSGACSSCNYAKITKAAQHRWSPPPLKSITPPTAIASP